MEENVAELRNQELSEKIKKELAGMYFTKNFRSATAEEWYVFLPSYNDPNSAGAVGKAIIHYDLQGNRDIFINTTVILDDPKLYKPTLYPLVYAVSDELINRLVGYANTLLSVHAGENSFQAEYVR
jgi:hypothetical protein